MERGHAERLAPMVDEAMKAAIADFSAARRALPSPPGRAPSPASAWALPSCAGLRLALQIPLTGVTTLEAMAAAAMAETGRTRAAAIHDAQRDEAYLLLKDDDAIIQPPVVLPFADAIAAHQVRLAPAPSPAPGAAQACESLGDSFTLSRIRQPDAIWVARLALAMPSPEDAPAPLYLRAPDAKLPAVRHERKSLV